MTTALTLCVIPALHALVKQGRSGRHPRDSLTPRAEAE
jgi:hypothetical protein